VGLGLSLILYGDSKGYGKMSKAFRVWGTICFQNFQGGFQLSIVVLIAELVRLIFVRWGFYSTAWEIKAFRLKTI